MFGSEVLDVAIGMAFLFLLLSLVASSVREGIESFFKARAVHLERGLRDFLDDRDGTLLTDVYNHPLVYSLFPGGYEHVQGAHGIARRVRGRNLPTNIPARAVARALVDVVSRGPADHPLSIYDAAAPRLTVERLRAALPYVRGQRLARMLILAVDGTEDMAEVERRLATWFDDAMGQVTILYRRHTQWWLLGIGLVTAVTINADAVALINHLSRSKAAREMVVARAQGFVGRNAALRDSLAGERERSAAIPDSATRLARVAAIDSAERRVEVAALGGNARAALDSLALPLGWPEHPRETLSFTHLIGLLISAFAIALGAPFWFEALKKLIAIRNVTKEPEGGTPGSREPAAGAAPLVRTPDAATGSPSPPVATAAASAAPGAPEPAYEPHRWAAGDPNKGLL